MCLNEIFYEKLSEISQVSGIDKDSILSKKREIDIVDARHILIKVMANYGMSKLGISRMMGLSVRNVQYIITNFDSRIEYSKWARKIYEIVMK